MKQAHSQVTMKVAECVTRDTAKVQLGAMTPSFPPVEIPSQTSKVAIRADDPALS